MLSGSFQRKMCSVVAAALVVTIACPAWARGHSGGHSRGAHSRGGYHSSSASGHHSRHSGHGHHSLHPGGGRYRYHSASGPHAYRSPAGLAWADKFAPAKHPYHRSFEAKKEFERLSGHPNGWPGHVVDHVNPLACGGPDAPSNMQWQTVAEARAKDKIERRGCRHGHR